MRGYWRERDIIVVRNERILEVFYKDNVRNERILKGSYGVGS